MNARCAQCGDLTREGWALCRTCHAHRDLQLSLRHVDSLGIDERRLQRALRYLVPRRRRYPTMAMFERLRRRIAELELDAAGWS